MPEELNKASLAPDDGAVVPRLSTTEIGYIGLRRSNRTILEEANREFQFPSYLKVVAEMRNNPTVAAAMLIYRMRLGRVTWRVEPPVNASEELKQRTKFIETCMHDMEDSWSSFVVEVLSYLEYGFACHEKIPRRRLLRNGSKFNDGLVGWRKLPPRSQSTISGWIYSDDGRDLLAVQQDLTNVYTVPNFRQVTPMGTRINIPREKVLLFRADATRENPEGRSLFKGCYIAYKQLELIQDQELIGIARDLGGVPIGRLPVKFMDPNASPDEKAVYDNFKTLVQNITTGSQGSIIIPQIYDPDSKLPMFDLELLESKGTPRFDTSKIIQRLQNDILMALSCDVIQITGGGQSFAVADAKTNLLSLSLSYRLKEIAEVLNNDLIPWTFKMNGWLDTDLPKFVPSDVDTMDLEVYSKAIQRLKAVSMLEVDRPLLNQVREALGVPPRPENEEPDVEALTLTDGVSRSGDSFSTASGGMNGTADVLPKHNQSDMNHENAA